MSSQAATATPRRRSVAQSFLDAFTWRSVAVALVLGVLAALALKPIFHVQFAVLLGRTLAVSALLLLAFAAGRTWQLPGVPLVIVESPYRALIGPVIAYLDVLDMSQPPGVPAPVTIVVLPEYVARHWWDRLLYNQAARRLKAALLGREHTVIADVPYRRRH